MIDRLTQALARQSVKRITDSKRISAAVLIPCYLKDGQYYLLFIQRSDRVRDHKSQISFPGGAHEPTDKSLAETALRETEEEVGIKREDVKMIGQLDDMATAGTNYVISPFVGLIPYPYDFKGDEFETDEIIEVPLAVLLNENCCKEGTAIVDGKPVDSYFYHCGDKVIWGATARILKKFLNIVSDLVAQGAPLEAD